MKSPSGNDWFGQSDRQPKEPTEMVVIAHTTVCTVSLYAEPRESKEVLAFLDLTAPRRVLMTCPTRAETR
jgi:hypothetical protein